MDEKEIEELFCRLKDSSDVSPETKEIFTILVKTTLDFRDKLKKETGTIVKVEDTKAALDWLFGYIRTREMPAADDSVRSNLFKRWMEELKGYL